MIRSTYPEPVFQRKRYTMDTWPLRYKHVATLNRFKVENWRERGYDQKYAAMVAQKREPLFWANYAFHRFHGNSTSASCANN